MDIEFVVPDLEKGVCPTSLKGLKCERKKLENYQRGGFTCFTQEYVIADPFF